MNNLLYLIPFILILVLWVKKDIYRAIYMVVITELIMASSYLFFGVSPRYLFVPYALGLGAVKVIKNKKNYRMPKWNIILFSTVLIYYLWVVFVQLGVHGYSISEYSFHRFLGRSLMYVATGFLIQFVIYNKSELIKLIKVVALFCGISALVGIGQVVFGGIFLDLRELLQKSPRTVSVSPTERAFGLQLFHIPFSYDMLMGSFLALPFWDNLKTKAEKIKSWGLWVLIIGGLLFSMTRSALGGFIIGFLVIALFYKKRILIYLGGLAVVLALLFLGIGRMAEGTSFQRITSTADGSFRVRRTLFTAGFRIIKNNPLGIGNGRYEEHIKENSVNFKDIKNWKAATNVGVHNHFLLNTIYFGWFGGVLSVLFILQLFFICRKVFKESKSKFQKNMSIIIAGFLVAYILNISFHNAGFFKGEATIWIVTGILLSLNRITKKENGTVS